MLKDTVRRLVESHPAEAERIRAWVSTSVRVQLAPRVLILTEIRGHLDAALPPLDALDDALAASASRLDSGPFRADMTVHAAHARHPAVRAAFARRGLPGCVDCAVGGDETLAQAALAEGWSLPVLLEELRELES